MTKIKRIVSAIVLCSFLSNINAQSIADELIKWKSLLDKGVITKQEFEVQKKRLLSLDSGNTKSIEIIRPQSNNGRNNSIDNSEIPQNFVDPEFSLKPYILTNENSLENLESTDATLESKVNALGLGGASVYYNIPDSKSPVRFRSGNVPPIIIKVNNNTDPAESIFLEKASETKKNRRRFLLQKVKLIKKSNNSTQQKIPVEFKRLQPGIFQIILPRELLPGEYAFFPAGESDERMTVKANCFGID